MNMVTQTITSTNEPPLISPYLNHKEASFIGLNLAEPSRIRNLSPIITGAAATKPAQPRSRSKEEDDEIGVFRAEKYFNSAIDADDTSSRSSSTTTATRSSCHGHQRFRAGEDDLRTASALNLEQVRARIQPRTPSSVRSESSWNSRSVLLQSSAAVNKINSSKAHSEKTKLINGKRFLSTLGCSCSDKNSVETKQVAGEEIIFNKSSTNSTTTTLTYKSSLHHNQNHHHSMIRSPRINIEPIKIQTPTRLDILSSKSPYKSSPMLIRSRSPEIFGTKVVSKTMSLERRFPVMSWDSPRLDTAAAAADSGSDASSDLFEIDSLTGKTNPFKARRGSDDLSAGCATPTTGYAPSEASIQWSVVTASAADHCSVASDFDDSASRAAAAAPRFARGGAELQQQRRRASALLGCKSQKAVSVARGESYRLSPGPTTSRRLPPGYDLPAATVRFMAGDSPARFEAEIAKLSVGQEQRSLAHNISRLASPSPRNNSSHLLFIQ